MKSLLRTAWNDFVVPMFRPPLRLQVAALCYRKKNGLKEVLLVTSRGTGRWIIPKGWPIDGLDAAGAALQEAWEEAGVRQGRSDGGPIGSYIYDKAYSGGLAVPVETLVFPIAVETMSDDFPEADERTRRWVRPEEAANLVREPELQHILKTF